MKSQDELTLERALAGDRAAIDLLVTRFSRVIQARAAHVLARFRARSGRTNISQELEDMTQEVFRVLFADGGRVIRNWDPSRGLSLDNYVGLVAERELAALSRSGRRSAWREDPTEDDSLEFSHDHSQAPALEEVVASKQFMEQLFDRLRERLKPQSLQLFYRLIVEEADVESVSEEMAMTPMAIYAWRSRLAKLARSIADELLHEGPLSSRRFMLKESP